MRYTLYLFLLSIILYSCKHDKSEELYATLSPKLISVQEAQQLLEKPNKLFIHISKKEAYTKEHIPSAHHLWRPDYGTKEKREVKGLRATKSEIEGLLQKLGFQKGNELIIYDTKGSVDALRFAWVLNTHGFHDYRIMDGGLVHWKQNNYPITQREPAIPKESNFILNTESISALVANYLEVSAALKDTNTIIIDTREPYEYYAKPFMVNKLLYSHKKGSFERGCIPGAVHLNWSDLVDLKTDHKIKAKEVIAYNLTELGITADKNVIVYCQSGSRSSHTAFVLKEIMGFPKVKNYDGSWIEWTYRNKYLGDAEIQQNTSEEEFKVLYDKLASQIKKKN